MKGNSKTTIIVLVVIAILLIFGMIIVGCSILKPAPAPTELVPTGTVAPPPVTDATWERVKTSLKLVVGTSADYPPFEYYTPQNQIDGFDMALIRAIGTQLGLQVEIHDYAFESLGSALQAGEIDVVTIQTISHSRQDQHAIRCPAPQLVTHRFHEESIHVKRQVTVVSNSRVTHTPCWGWAAGTGQVIFRTETVRAGLTKRIK